MAADTRYEIDRLTAGDRQDEKRLNELCCLDRLQLQP